MSGDDSAPVPCSNGYGNCLRGGADRPKIRNTHKCTDSCGAHEPEVSREPTVLLWYKCTGCSRLCIARKTVSDAASFIPPTPTCLVETGKTLTKADGTTYPETVDGGICDFVPVSRNEANEIEPNAVWQKERMHSRLLVSESL